MLVLIVRNPLDPSSIERVEHDSPSAVIRAAFPQWPSTGRIYDLEGIGTPERAIALIDGPGLQSRDITPQDEAGIERLERAVGPIMVTIPPADPVTAIIAVAVTLLAVAAAYLLLPKPPSLDNSQSSNRSLSDRSNKPRPGSRIPDIFGTVRSVPDLLAVPFRRFENNLELEISFMCVGRGAYDVEDVRDGDTLLAKVAGAAAAFYGPGTSPNSGAAPQLQIGSPIVDKVETIVPMASVNGQLLRPPNANHLSGNANIRFVAPDLIEAKNGVDFTKYFDPDDELTVSAADFGSTNVYFDATTKVCRFYPDYRIEFQDFDPSTLWEVGQRLVISNAGFASTDANGAVIYVDVSGTYPIKSISGAGSGSPINPATLFANGQEGSWYDPSDMATLFQNQVGDVPVTAVGQKVAFMRDKSGRGHHVSQGDSGRWPVLRQDSNGKYFLEFDGVYDMLMVGWATGLMPSFDRVSGIRFASNDTNQYVFGDGPQTTNNFGIFGFFFPAPSPLGLHDGAVACTVQPPSTTAPFISTERHSPNGGSRLALNNDAYATGDTGNGQNSGVTIGSLSPAHGTTDYTAAMSFYGSVQVGRDLTDAETKGLRSYMAGKAGVAALTNGTGMIELEH